MTIYITFEELGRLLNDGRTRVRTRKEFVILKLATYKDKILVEELMKIWNQMNMQKEETE